MKKPKKIKWIDAVIYSAESKIPKDVSLMETTGDVVYFDKGWTIIRNKKTVNITTGALHPASKKATYFCIPSMALKNYGDRKNLSVSGISSVKNK